MFDSQPGKRRAFVRGRFERRGGPRQCFEPGPQRFGHFPPSNRAATGA